MKNNLKKNFWNKKKVFITGHTGFKGSWLCLFLHHLGAEVTGYSLAPNTKPNLFGLTKIEKIIKKSVIGDVRDYEKLKKEIKKSKANFVFHLAAQPLVRLSYLHPKDTFDINFSGSLNILQCIKEIKKIHTGIIITTDKVYDINKNKIFKETDVLGGSDPYSASKVCVEFLYNSYQKSFFSKSDKMIATVRAGNVIGGGDWKKDRLIPDIFKSIFSNKKLIIRKPNAIRPWQHVLDCLNGYIIATEYSYKSKFTFNSWNFAPPLKNQIKVIEFIDKLRPYFKLTNKSITIKKNNFFYESERLNLVSSKAKKELGWETILSQKNVIQYIVNWYLHYQQYKNMKSFSTQQIIEFCKLAKRNKK